MNKKLFGLIVALLLVAIGAVVCYFAKYEPVQITGFAVTMFGAGLAVNQLWGNRSKEAKTWVVALGIALIGIGCFILGTFMFMSKEQLTTFIGLIISLTVFIVGIVVTVVGNTSKKQVE